MPVKKKTVKASGSSIPKKTPASKASSAKKKTPDAGEAKQAASEDTEETATPEPQSSEPAPEPSQELVAPDIPATPPETGKVRVKYNHYDKEFMVNDGLLNWESIDDEFCISFAFKGDWIPHLSDNHDDRPVIILF